MVGRILLLFVVCLYLVDCQNTWDYLPTQPIPPRVPGRAMGLSVAPIRMEAFLDLQCSDSKNAWGVIRELLDLYPTKIYFILHEFSLSYKENSYWASQSANVVNTLQPGQYFDYIDLVYENQAAFQNSVTFDMTGAQVWGLFESYAAQVGVESNQFYSQMNNSTLTWQVTRNWKWAASKGVFATPSYLLNGVLLPNCLWDLETWVGQIEQLLHET
mmetsp:Transcript_743/g.922  ORF Transcript_743/g.922 Transcript_743/m.922 type:complete len:215 (-) Transcript_743:26-670(-)